MNGVATVFSVMNAVGLAAFGAVGSLKAIDSDLDVLGVIVLGMLTALGGGVTRDLLVDAVPYALQSTSDVTFAFGGVAVAIVAERIVGHGELLGHPAVDFPDAVGLAAFAATGALVGAEAALSPFGIVVTATLTGVGGGTLSDVLLDRVPFVLHEDFYATCAVLGGVTFLVADAANATPQVAALACAAVTLGTRVGAVLGDWHLPQVE